ncbi:MULTISPECIES: DNA repair protein RecO [Maribellus]|uniref:DNA repair protein RecO n=1 Tax=Maribellus comscasis TaxID=2681766 RepID=A0A6I6K318_9BACT|nr:MULTISPECIES: DNA repair protein RecO [Maribellus]MCG6188275.1 DNA repair protein RecO [Maribellus maritimus]QGY44324.1 DNA repair protein RecO [Maribellus comscasis]
MLASTEGIVLRLIKYGESSVIATIFTREFGRQSFIINSVRKKKSKTKAGFLQPLFLVDLVTYQKQSREVQRTKEIKNTPVYQNIPFDIVKSTQAVFLAEMLYKTINEEESYPEMFDFIKNALLLFDFMEKNLANFHLYFLYRLTEYLGFFPDTTRQAFENWFDLKKGTVVPYEPSHPLFMNKEVTAYFCTLSTLKFHEIAELKIPRRIRETLLEKLIEYYNLHFEHLGEIKSLKVLQEVFE